MVNISEFEFLYYQMYLQDIIFNKDIDEVDFDVIPKSLIPDVIKMIFYEKREVLMSFPNFRQKVMNLLRDNILQPGFTLEERQDYIALLKEIRYLFFERKQLQALYLRESVVRKIKVNSETKFGHCLHDDYLLIEMLRNGENPEDNSKLRPSLQYLKNNYRICKNYEKNKT